MRLSKMIKQIIVTIGGKAEDLGGKSISDLIKYSQPLVENLVEKINEGGNNDFVVTYTEGEGETVIADKTYAEISAAIEAGKNVKAKRIIDGVSYIMQITTFVEGAIVFALTFPQIEGGEMTVIELVIGHESDETITGYTQALQNAQG